MKETPDAPASAAPSLKEFRAEPSPIAPPQRKRPILLAAVVLGLAIAFFEPLRHLLALALGSDLYSHVLLIPVVCAYLAWDNRKRIQLSRPQPAWALIPAAVGLISLLMFFNSSANPQDPQQIENYLFYSIFAFVSFVVAAHCAFIGRNALRVNIFPILFLFWITPFSVPMREGIESFFQHASADAAYWFIKLSGVPIFRDGLIFQMPTINMEVAPQCSGIRSSLVLFITSMIGSYVFIRSPWKRAVIVLLVVPLGILRNGIRILVLAQLCYHIGPEMIDSWFHSHGGPPLFALTLIPLFLMLYLFWRSENKPWAARRSGDR